MTAVSRVSRKTTKKTGTAKTLTVMVMVMVVVVVVVVLVVVMVTDVMKRSGDGGMGRPSDVREKGRHSSG